MTEDSPVRLLDTDVVSYIMSGRPQARICIPHLEGVLAAVSFVTVAELIRGAYQARWSVRRVTELEDYLRDRYVVLPYTIEVARHWAALMSDCARGGYVPGQNDAWIAATALAFNCEIVSGDAGFSEMAKHHPSLFVLSIAKSP